MNKQEAINYWIKSSEEDLRTAEDLFKTKHYHYCLFFCHLFVEKIIKGLIVMNTSENPLPIHNLRRLVRDAEVKLSEEQLELLDEINEFNVKARYNDIDSHPAERGGSLFRFRLRRKNLRIHPQLKAVVFSLS